MRSALKILLTAVALLPAPGAAQAGCSSDVVEAMYFQDAGPAPGQSAPCCGSHANNAIASGKPHASAASSPAAAPRCDGSTEASALEPLPGRLAFAGPWRRYCARSTRLLR